MNTSTSPAAGQAWPMVPLELGDDALLSVEAAAQMLGMSTSWLEKKLAARELPHVRLGRGARMTVGQVRAVIAAHTVPAAIHRPDDGATSRPGAASRTDDARPAGPTPAPARPVVPPDIAAEVAQLVTPRSGARRRPRP